MSGPILRGVSVRASKKVMAADCRECDFFRFV